MREHLKNDLMTKLSIVLSAEALNAFSHAFDEVITHYDVSKSEVNLTVTGREEFLSLIKTYVMVKKMEGLSDLTINNYFLHLKSFVMTTNKFPAEVTSNDVRLYLYHYQNCRKISNRSLDKVRSAICAFFRWAASENYIPRNPTETLKPIKYEEKPRKAIDQVDLELMRRGCKTNRELAILEVFYSTGCRVSELINLKIDDINWITREVKIFGKGQKHRVSYLNAKALIALHEYLKSRTHSSPYLFCNDRGGGSMTKSNIERIIRIISENAGLKDKHITPHTMRHTTATQALKNGMPIQDIQKLLGHENVATTMIYAKTSLDEVRSKHQTCVL